MPLCRVAWQAVASRITKAAPLLRGQVPFRQMSSGSVPGSSGEKWIYGLLTVGAGGIGIFYAYKVVTSDQAKYRERIEYIQQRNTEEWKPKPWPPPSLESDETETKEVTDTNEDAKDAAAEETEGIIAGESQVQSEEHAESQVQSEEHAESQVQSEEHAESTDSDKGEESPVAEATSGVPGGEQDVPANSKATQAQG